MQDVTIIGCGDDDQLEKLQADGFRTLQGDLDYQEDTPEIPLHGSDVYYLVAPQGGGRSDYRMLNFCRRLHSKNKPKRLVYISTSGVYGDCGGAVVTEETPINPQTARAQRRASAEQQLQEQAKKLGFALVILRVTGIYGPGRLPVARILQGHPVLKIEEASFTNRIHALDLVRICLAAMEKGEDGDIFNVCDGQKSSMTEYFTAVADLHKLPRPKQISMEEAEREMNPLMLSYLKESRRMDNRKMREKLGIELLYPTLDEGLKACGDEQ